MNYFILSGEASGDLHAANLAKALYQQDDAAKIKAWGGPKLKEVGAEVTKTYDSLAIMGFVEVITKLPQVFSNLNQAVEEIQTFQADAVILVDFSGFNLRLAKKLRKSGYKGKLFYYISPKLWVWNARRVQSFIDYIDAVFCILPFEVPWYQEHGYSKAYYIGNPLMDEIAAFTPNPQFRSENKLNNKDIIALLPGSRKNEVQQILPKMLEVIPGFENHQFVIAATGNMVDLIKEQMAKAQVDLPLVMDQTYDLLVNSEAALVTSGTATLETALLGTPLVLDYRGNALSYHIAKAVVSIDYIGLPNLILNKEMVKELIQNNLTAKNQFDELNALLYNTQRQEDFQRDVQQLRQKVGGPGASQHAAKKMIAILNGTD